MNKIQKSYRGKADVGTILTQDLYPIGASGQYWDLNSIRS